jgi:hypothetical protein
MIAANFDNFLFLLLVVVAVLFQLLAKMAGKKSKDQTKRTSTPRTPAPLQRAPTESDEDRIRKLLEALGQPPTSRPPPPVVPRTNIPPRPLAPVQPPTSPFSQLRREKVAQARGQTPKEISFSAADCQGNGEDGSTRLREFQGRTVVPIAAVADLHGTRGNLRGKCRRQLANAEGTKNRLDGPRCSHRPSGLARRNYSPRNSRTTARFAKTRI